VAGEIDGAEELANQGANLFLPLILGGRSDFNFTAYIYERTPQIEIWPRFKSLRSAALSSLNQTPSNGLDLHCWLLARCAYTSPYSIDLCCYQGMALEATVLQASTAGLGMS